MSVLDEICRTRDGVPCPNCGDVMLEKDAPGVYECACGTLSELDVTFHAKVDRWEDRSDDPSTSVLEAWSDGILLDAYDKDKHNLDADEIRYHHETTTVILRRDIGLVTAIDYRTARDGIQRSVVEALIETGATSATVGEAVSIAGLEEIPGSDEASEIIRSDRGNAPASGGTDTPDRIEP